MNGSKKDQQTSALSIGTDKGNSQSEDDDSDNEVEYHRGAVLNLLDIGNASHWKEGGRISLSNLSGNMSSLSQLAQVSAYMPDSTQRHESSIEVLNDKLNADISITKIFEPKFMEVYNKYVESIQRPLDLSKHLLSVCLENLIEFCCWTRANAVQCQWIHTKLDENSDLRPEVRNGLAMILIYAFSSAQAVLQNETEADMFSVLQDADKGMGIVNKTSLKIYNDPFNYFNFLKACISGLIDAGKIPENERQNQPKKPKRVSENKDEILAYSQLQQLIIKWIEDGEHTLVRSKIGYIMDIWQQRQKSIRNRRFSMALALMSGSSAAASFARPLLSTAISALSPRMFDENATSSTSGPTDATTPGLTSLTDISDGDTKHLNHSEINAAAVAAAANALLTSAGLDPSIIAKAGMVVNASGHQLNSHSIANTGLILQNLDSSFLNNPTFIAAAQLVRQHQNQQQQLLPGSVIRSAVLNASYTASGNNSRPKNSFDSPPAKYQRTAMSSSAGAAHITAAISANDAKEQDGYQSTNSYAFTASSSTNQAISILRFERVSGREWEYQEVKVFNIDSLLEHYHGLFWLLDELQFTKEERQQKKLHAQSTGMISLNHEFQQRKALVTSWLPIEHAHLHDFLKMWHEDKVERGKKEANRHNNDKNSTNNMSLLEYWRQHSVSNTSNYSNTAAATETQSTAMDVDPSSLTDNHFATATQFGRGIIAYEVVLQVGIVFRRNEQLGILEDCWRLIYPQELQQRLQQHQKSTFAHFISLLFPQLRNVMSKQLSEDQVTNTIIKYYPHRLEPPILQPPKLEEHGQSTNVYQTIGTLQEPVETVFAQFETSFIAFHDLILQET